MRNNLLVLIGILLLASCASAPANTEKSLTYRQQLDIYKNMKIRLYEAFSEIEPVAVYHCWIDGNQKNFGTHRLSDYPEKLRPVAESYWGLSDSPASLYDIPVSKKGNQNNIGVTPNTYIPPRCYTPLILNYDDAPNAYTDGLNINVTTGLLRRVDDLALMLILAHELGHIVFNHADKEPSEKLEREADRFALFILAGSSLDYRKAATQTAASRQPHMSGDQSYLDTTKRADYLRAVVAEIEKLQANGMALVP